MDRSFRRKLYCDIVIDVYIIAKLIFYKSEDLLLAATQAEPTLSGGDKNHNYHPIEQDANSRALRYFVGKYGNGFADNGGWSFRYNPIKNYDPSLPGGYTNTNNQQALSQVGIRMSSLDLLSLPLDIEALPWLGLSYYLYYNNKY